MDINDISFEFITVLLLNLAAGALGFVPSFLLTGMNINGFGVVAGTVLSLTGEIFGAVLGFYLYRFGFSKVQPSWKQSRFWNYMHKQPAATVFWGILLFRLLPFIPSGLVTAGAALTPINGLLFFIASSLGKIPAVLLEAAIVYGIIETVPAVVQYAVGIAVCLTALFVWLRKRKATGNGLRQ
ncbi:VTT domain-containing protein [Planococcus liqunii]|uniref:TVP38/TMEM64 family protein n=1 Tax=Planococcus liqunii TaxID=3058394 RepID=UPI00260CBBED|nr:VTT domain-containing protein [Planococcus sp. N056]WKA49651.1 VTT domain-containing protein [Planococcus sp. N056]